MILAAFVIGAELAIACLVLAGVLLIGQHRWGELYDALDRLELLLDRELTPETDAGASTGTS